MVAAVSIDRVHKHYGALHALNDINFDIEQGTFFGLLGPNGAGKSTLISIMAGLCRTTSGTIRIMGNDVQQQWRQARQALGVVPQEIAHDPFFTVHELLRLQSGYFGLGKENTPWIEELLETLSLSDKADTNMQFLSGGMKRRVLIAQALVHKPPVVVLDEPTAGVDVELRRMLWEFTQRLHSMGHTIVLTTHYLEEAEALCDRIAIINKGELIALDDKAALLARQPYRLLRLNLAHKCADLPADLHDKVVSCTEGELVLRLHRETDNIGHVLEALRERHIHFTDLKTEEPNLEDVFVNLTTDKESV